MKSALTQVRSSPSRAAFLHRLQAFAESLQLTIRNSGRGICCGDCFEPCSDWINLQKLMDGHFFYDRAAEWQTGHKAERLEIAEGFTNGTLAYVKFLSHAHFDDSLTRCSNTGENVLHQSVWSLPREACDVHSSDVAV